MPRDFDQMETWWDRWGTAGLALMLVLVLPLLGVALAGRRVTPYLEFPPLTKLVEHEPFSWPVFVVLGLFIVLSVAPFLRRILQSNFQSILGDSTLPLTLGHQASPITHHASCFPWWGWLGLGWTAIWWLLAWTRMEWMASLQTFTFTPLWFGYIIIVNALTFRRTGRCMFMHRPRYFWSLFPLSALFWWMFEYLNRFVQNWFYRGGGELTAWEYVVQATLPFSTVLPAVIGTAELLSASPRLSAGLGTFVKLDAGNDRTGGQGLLAVAVAGLLGIGLWPNYLFPLVWVAPLLLITALQLSRRESTIFGSVRQGDWRTLWVMALAALVCGFFWELWNVYSLAHWEYAIPFVHRFRLFEMPILGYAGYLPFGLECLAVADLCLTRKFSGGVAYYRDAGAGTDFAQRKPTVAER